MIIFSGVVLKLSPPNIHFSPTPVLSIGYGDLHRVQLNIPLP